MVVDFLAKGKGGGNLEEVEVTIETPYRVLGGAPLEYNGELHLFGGNGNDAETGSTFGNWHYKFNGVKWIKMERMPGQYYFKASNVTDSDVEYSPPVVYNNKVLIPMVKMNSSNYAIFEWDGLNWSESAIPFVDSESREQVNFVYNGVLHTIAYGAIDSSKNGYVKHYYYDESTSAWVQQTDVPLNNNTGTSDLPSIFIYKNKIHYMFGWGGGDNNYVHFECGSDGVWESSFSKPSVLYYFSGARFFVCGNKLICLPGNSSSNPNCYYYDDTNSTWKYYTAMPTEPHYNVNYSVATCGNKLYWVGGDYGDQWDTTRCFYELDTTLDHNVVWELVNSSRYACYYWLPVFVYNNELYIGAGENDGINDDYCIYKLVNNELVKAMDLPSNSSCYDTVVYNDEIHLFIDENKHYKWNASTSQWDFIENTPKDTSYSCILVYNNRIHILGCNSSDQYMNHYAWDGTNWEALQAVPYEFTKGQGVVYNNEIHIFGSDQSSYTNYHTPNHYKWNGVSWTKVPGELACVDDSHPIFVYDGVVHILGVGYANFSLSSGYGTDDYKNARVHFTWDENGYKPFAILPDNIARVLYNVYSDNEQIKACVFNGDIYLIFRDCLYRLTASEYARAKRGNLADFKKVTAKLYKKP